MCTELNAPKIPIIPVLREKIKVYREYTENYDIVKILTSNRHVCVRNLCV